MIHGGINPDEGFFYDQLEIFDISKPLKITETFKADHHWLVGSIFSKKKKMNDDVLEHPAPTKPFVIGKLQMHSMFGLHDDNENRQVWMHQSSVPTGILLFGGINEKKSVNNDLWLIEPDYARNKQEVFTPKGAYKYHAHGQKIFVTARRLEPAGKPPMPRFGHAVCGYNKRFMIIHGGRNDSLIKETSHVILNDIHLYDYLANTWTAVVMYGCLLEARALHQIAIVNEETLVLFGGTNLKSFLCTTQGSVMTFSKHTQLTTLQTSSKLRRASTGPESSTCSPRSKVRAQASIETD